jgi:hypothetical protein
MTPYPEKKASLIRGFFMAIATTVEIKQRIGYTALKIKHLKGML